MPRQTGCGPTMGDMGHGRPHPGFLELGPERGFETLLKSKLALLPRTRESPEPHLADSGIGALGCPARSNGGGDRGSLSQAEQGPTGLCEQAKDGLTMAEDLHRRGEPGQLDGQHPVGKVNDLDIPYWGLDLNTGAQRRVAGKRNARHRRNSLSVRCQAPAVLAHRRGHWAMSVAIGIVTRAGLEAQAPPARVMAQTCVG